MHTIRATGVSQADTRPDVRLRDHITRHEATQVLGCLPPAVRRYIANGTLHEVAGQAKCNLMRAEVEALAIEIYDWRKRFAEPQAYWVAAQRAAEILRVSLPRLRGLSESGRIPSVVHSDGTRLFRRQQLETIARRSGVTPSVARSG